MVCLSMHQGYYSRFEIQYIFFSLFFLIFFLAHQMSPVRGQKLVLTSTDARKRDSWTEDRLLKTVSLALTKRTKRTVYEERDIKKNSKNVLFLPFFFFASCYSICKIKQSVKHIQMNDN